MARLPRTMTVQELIDALEELPNKSAPVYMTGDYGDHPHTLQILPVTDVGPSAHVHETAYSNSGWCVTQPDDEDTDPEDVPDEEDGPRAVILYREGDGFFG